MRKLVLLLWAFLCLPTICYAQSSVKPCYPTANSTCNPGIQSASSVPINTASASIVQLVALVANQWIFITSWDVMAAGTTNVKLVYGTGTNCGTGTTDLTGAYPLIAQAGIAKGNGTGAVLFVPRGNALCVNNSGSIQISGSVSYAQFQP